MQLSKFNCIIWKKIILKTFIKFRIYINIELFRRYFSNQYKRLSGHFALLTDQMSLFCDISEYLYKCSLSNKLFAIKINQTVHYTTYCFHLRTNIIAMYNTIFHIAMKENPIILLFELRMSEQTIWSAMVNTIKITVM